MISHISTRAKTCAVSKLVFKKKKILFGRPNCLNMLYCLSKDSNESLSESQFLPIQAYWETQNASNYFKNSTQVIKID